MHALTTGYVPAAYEAGQWVARGNVAATYEEADRTTRLLVCSGAGARYNRHRFQTMAICNGHLIGA